MLPPPRGGSQGDLFEDGVSPFLRALQRSPDQTLRAMVPVMRRFGQAYRRELTMKQLSGRPGLRRVTGNLARSVSHAVLRDGNEAVELKVLFGAKYAAAHEFGGPVQVPAATVRAHIRQGKQVRAHQRRAFTRSMPARLKARETMLRMLPELETRVAETALDILANPQEGR